MFRQKDRGWRVWGGGVGGGEDGGRGAFGRGEGGCDTRGEGWVAGNKIKRGKTGSIDLASNTTQ